MTDENNIQVYSKESEMMVLGCMLTSCVNLNAGSSSLNDSDFHLPEHEIIFRVLKDFYNKEKPADVHLTCEELKKKDLLVTVGGVAYITTLAQYAGTSGYIESYCEELKRLSYARKTINLLHETQNTLLKNPGSPEEVADSFHQKFMDLGKAYSPNDKASLREILSGSKSRIEQTPMIERIQKRHNYFKEHGKPFLTGIPTGFKELDNQVTLLEDTNFIILAGRPAMGKTALGLTIASHVCLNLKKAVGIISLEMGADQLTERLLSLRTGVDGEKIKRGTFNSEELKKLESAVPELETSSLFIHDTAVSSVHQVASKARRLKDEDNIQLLVIDYLQLLSAKNSRDGRQYEVAEVSRTLKKLAMELKIPIICIAQLSRKVDDREDKKPRMSDLRDSGQIEQDADSIIAVYRRECYDPKDKPGQAEIIVLKNRHGAMPKIDVAFKNKTGLFTDLESMKILNKELQMQVDFD